MVNPPPLRRHTKSTHRHSTVTRSSQIVMPLPLAIILSLTTRQNPRCHSIVTQRRCIVNPSSLIVTQRHPIVRRSHFNATQSEPIVTHRHSKVAPSSLKTTPTQRHPVVTQRHQHVAQSHSVVATTSLLATPSPTPAIYASLNTTPKSLHRRSFVVSR